MSKTEVISVKFMNFIRVGVRPNHPTYKASFPTYRKINTN